MKICAALTSSFICFLSLSFRKHKSSVRLRTEFLQDTVGSTHQRATLTENLAKQIRLDPGTCMIGESDSEDKSKIEFVLIARYLARKAHRYPVMRIHLTSNGSEGNGARDQHLHAEMRTGTRAERRGRCHDQSDKRVEQLDQAEERSE